MTATQNTPQSTTQSKPWWREPYLWLVLAGPISVVLASAVTWVFIMRGADRLVAEDYYQQGLQINRTIESATPPLQPALVGRNHSATGGRK
jgi:uncharacterized protein